MRTERSDLEVDLLGEGEGGTIQIASVQQTIRLEKS